MTSAPIEHLQDALLLESDAKIDLWEIRLRTSPTIIRFWNGVERTWQTNLYQGIACQLQGEASPGEGQNNRPVLTVVNPEKIFGPFAAEGHFDLAEVTRKRVLQAHFVSDVNIFEQRIWFVGRVPGMSGQGIQLELRSSTDMPAWKTPRRHYTPPEYPFVTI